MHDYFRKERERETKNGNDDSWTDKVGGQSFVRRGFTRGLVTEEEKRKRRFRHRIVSLLCKAELSSNGSSSQRERDPPRWTMVNCIVSRFSKPRGAVVLLVSSSLSLSRGSFQTQVSKTCKR